VSVVRRRRCAILGASGYIGQHFARLLAEHPWFEPVVLTSTERSKGRTLGDVWLLPEEIPDTLARARLTTATPRELRRAGIEVAFSALPSGKAGTIETALAKKGIPVFSNASDHRMDRDVPLLVPEVNADHLDLLTARPGGRAAIVNNPNCTAAGLVVGLAPIVPLLDPVRVYVATYQALSGAGVPGVPSLHIADNVVPFIADEEEKVAAESLRMLRSARPRDARPVRMEVVAQCARVAVRDGHLEAVTIEARRRPSLPEIRAAWTGFDPLALWDLPTAPRPPIELRSEPDRPQPLRDRWAGSPRRARGMAVTIGRVRWDPPLLRFFLLSHNAVRGGAGGSVLNAELALRAGWLGHPVGRPPS